ncbi:sugar ABC transporter ATP-binding protein [Pannonibacter phragmitetus]|uniref:sugar ABC transporter ATP-binding protein n=1 Tax=Pannonibacter phragmitetus TaxID=121719 RepID=UPI000F02ADAE|nr:sugar ABC transporter ATP-binding protein [Pannonibacter phragmitetus]
MSVNRKPLVEMTGIAKHYPGVKALDGVNFTLEAGEVHVLFGENGAGKSTLISILAGVNQPSAGEIRLDGELVHFAGVRDAQAAGVGAVFQEFSLVPTMTVAENIYLGDEPRRGPFIDRRAMVREARALFARLGFDVDVSRRVLSLSRAGQQMVEIAKALHRKARILILDEPTASLTERETERLFAFIRSAVTEGVGVVYISHRIQEFQAIASRITVLRDGRLIGTVDAQGISERALVEMMTGRPVDEIYPAITRAAAPEPVLTIRGLHAWGVAGVDLDIRAGEVLGVAGLVGSGKSRCFRAMLGLNRIEAGEVRLKGRDVTGQPVRRLLREGIFYLPSDRKSEGLVLGATTRDNLKLALMDRADMRSAAGLLSPSRLSAEAGRIGRKVDLADAYMGRMASSLSGGNQQKILFGKGFAEDREIYIFDEPTVGVDMGTRAALYRIIKQVAEAGKAVVVISSDLHEVMHLAHRLIVFSQGRISAEFDQTQISEEAVLRAFFSNERHAA